MNVLVIAIILLANWLLVIILAGHLYKNIKKDYSKEIIEQVELSNISDELMIEAVLNNHTSIKDGSACISQQ